MRFILIFLLICFGGTFYAQDTTPSSFDDAKAEYQKNIKKSRINGVYIPKNLDDAFIELNQLSSPEAIKKFKAASEEVVAKKLHFGLGRWIVYNWNFYRGSRYSYYLSQLGISNPDDMATFTIVSFHRHLNKRPQEIDKRVKDIRDRKEREREGQVQKVITRKREDK